LIDTNLLTNLSKLFTDHLAKAFWGHPTMCLLLYIFIYHIGSVENEIIVLRTIATVQ